MENFAAQLITVFTIAGGVMAIVTFIKQGFKEEKTNAVEIAKLQKDIQQQQIANLSLREEMRNEVHHVQSDIKEIKQNQDEMRRIQSDMSGDIKSILRTLSK